MLSNHKSHRCSPAVSPAGDAPQLSPTGPPRLCPTSLSSCWVPDTSEAAPNSWTSKAACLRLSLWPVLTSPQSPTSAVVHPCGHARVECSEGKRQCWMWGGGGGWNRGIRAPGQERLDVGNILPYQEWTTWSTSSDAASSRVKILEALHFAKELRA